MGLQFFGVVEIDEPGQAMTVTLKNRIGKSLYSVELNAK
jgi:hypothetical protein